MANKYKPTLIGRIRQWYLNKFVYYVTIQQNNEHFFLSPRLWRQVMNDIPQGQRNSLCVWFKKYPREDGRMEYLMIFNPDFDAELSDDVMAGIREDVKEEQDFEKSLADKPRSVQIIERMKRLNSRDNRRQIPWTAPVQYNVFGHIGFQGVQPSPAEIVYEYGLEQQSKRRFRHEMQLTDRVSIGLKPIVYKPEVYGGRKAYILTDRIVARPTPTFATPFAEQKEEYIRQRSQQRRALGRMMRKK